MNSDYLKKDDCYLESENAFKSLIEDYKPDYVIGDPFYNKFFKKIHTKFIEVPHLAVSSRLYWNHQMVYVGDDVQIKEELKDKI